MKTKGKVNSKINDQIKKYLYLWIIHHPQDMQSPFLNDGLKFNIDVSAARPLALACPANVWGNVPTSRPILDGTIIRQRGDKLQGRRGREAKEASRAREGKDATNANGEQGEGEGTGRHHTDNPTTNDDQRRCAMRQGRSENSAVGGVMGGGGISGVHPDPRGPSSPRCLWRLGTSQP